VNLGTLGAKSGRSPTTASGSTRPTRLTLASECANVDELLAASVEAFRQHPDYHIVTSFPGLRDITGARLLAEIGDDPQRFRDPRGLKAFAGAAPITVPPVAARRSPAGGLKNNRLAAVGFVWASRAQARPSIPLRDGAGSGYSSDLGSTL
jgi:transposase